MIKLIPGKEYNLKNIHKVPYEHVVSYVMPQELLPKNNEVWETFYYKTPNEEKPIGRVIIPQRGIVSLVKNIITCYNYFPAGNFSPEKEENPQEIKEWLIMIQRLEEFKSPKNICAFASPKKRFLFLN